jgi:hypothetical protein
MESCRDKEVFADFCTCGRYSWVPLPVVIHTGKAVGWIFPSGCNNGDFSILIYQVYFLNLFRELFSPLLIDTVPVKIDIESQAFWQQLLSPRLCEVSLQVRLRHIHERLNSDPKRNSMPHRGDLVPERSYV